MFTIEKYSLVVIREFIAANWDAFVDYAKENEVDPEIIYQQIDGRESAVESTYDVLGMIGQFATFKYFCVWRLQARKLSFDVEQVLG